MNRLAGIIVAAAGFIIAILSITKFVPGITTTGVILILFGGLIIGLSFVDKPLADGADRMSTASTLGNIFFSPSDVFRDLRRHPRWLVALLIMAAMSATYTNLFQYRLGADRVATFAIEKTLEMLMMNEEARKAVEASRAETLADNRNPVIRASQGITGVASSFFGYAFLAMIFMLFALAMGGKINFWQALSAAVYAAFPVAVIRFVLNTLVLFLKDPNDIHPILGQYTLIQDNPNFLVTASEHPVIFTLLGSLSVLGFYWIWLNAVGLKNAGEKVTGTIGWSASIAVYVVLILISAGMAFLFPGFIS